MVATRTVRDALAMPVVHWNGTDVPDELRRLPAADYVIEPIVRELSTDEEQGVRVGLDDVEHGRVVSHDEIRARYLGKRSR